ncbi:cell wall metabolism sensor histidine kinase WalK [Arthrobacter sp. ISL-5]|uniref:sensor histidine kinase n=1 Tax=Arthrobacter sp. ISL-5 TaxID=2819111 RepID=UPI001BE93FB2|nr:HAMP domain-containing sensor histidine kinase [Arthrobacter sp. ISL-5]MBT2555917.1 HAMP domain-containing histidine kinase [Arthrobacter sp. ISL-5]
MITLLDFGIILLTAAAVAALVAALAGIALRFARHTSMLLRLLIVVAATVASIAAATIAVAVQMYISDHDLIVLFWVIGVGAVISLGVAALMGLGISRTSDRLRSTARAIGDGQIVVAEDYAGLEFAALAQELAETSQRLARSREDVATLEQSRRRLVAWISHDLRTPLAALRAMAESLEDGVAEEPDRYHRQIRVQAETLASMVDDLFELSKIQSGTLSLNMEPVSLFDLVSDTVADLHPVAASRSITLKESRTGNLTLYGDARELSRVIGNLLMNAIEHSPANSEILISARETENEHVALSVVDAGGGIPEEDLGRIFDAGWRGTPSRTPTPTLDMSAGAGLGLAIVAGIVEAHAGGVTVHNVPGGCQFDVTLPRFGARTS